MNIIQSFLSCTDGQRLSAPKTIDALWHTHTKALTYHHVDESLMRNVAGPQAGRKAGISHTMKNLCAVLCERNLWEGATTFMGFEHSRLPFLKILAQHLNEGAVGVSYEVQELPRSQFLGFADTPRNAQNYHWADDVADDLAALVENETASSLEWDMTLGLLEIHTPQEGILQLSCVQTSW